MIYCKINTIKRTKDQQENQRFLGNNLENNKKYENDN